MNVNCNFSCQCKIGKNKLTFRRPGFLDCTIIKHFCPDCGSEYLIKFKRAKKSQGAKDSNHLECSAKLLCGSDLLKALIKEQEEYKDGEVNG